MKTTGTSLMALALVLLPGGCGPPTRTAWKGTAEPMKQHGKTTTLDALTFTRLDPNSPVVIAVVQCLSVHVVNPKTRSQRIVAETTVVQTGLGTPPASLPLSCFTENKKLMISGRYYLVAACDSGEWYPAWSLAGCVEVDKDHAEQPLAEGVRAYKETIAK